MNQITISVSSTASATIQREKNIIGQYQINRWYDDISRSSLRRLQVLQMKMTSGANGFDGDEQAVNGCRLRPLAIGCGNGTQWYIWTNASADGYPVWVQNEDCTPFDDESVHGESVHGDGHGLGWPDSYRDGYIGD